MTRRAPHTIAVLHRTRHGETEVLASREILATLREAKKACEEMAASVPPQAAAHRAQGVVYLPAGKKYRKVFRLDLMEWEAPRR